MDEELTKCRNQTFSVEEYCRQNKPVYLPPDLAHLEELLNQNKLADFLGETVSHLSHMLSNKAIDTSVLGLFRLDIVQLVHSFLKLKGIQAHKLYTGKTNDQLLMYSLSSIEDMEEYLKYLVNTAMAYRDFAAQPTSIAEEIKEYIHKHYGDDLTRNDLAEIVYLNPDYLARLFKRETGVSLGSYVIQVRIAAAKHLLETTHMSVYTIANKTGYKTTPISPSCSSKRLASHPTSIKRNSRLRQRCIITRHKGEEGVSPKAMKWLLETPLF